MGSHEHREVKPRRIGRGFLGRGLVLLLVIGALLPAAVCGAVTLSQWRRFRAQCGVKAAALAEASAQLIGAEGLGLHDAAALQGAAFGELFRLSGFQGGDVTAWAVYAIDGTQATPVAGEAALQPEQREILAARSEGASLARHGSVATALSILYRAGKPVGFVQITVDSSLFESILRRSLLRTLLSLGAAAAVGGTVFLSLGAAPRFRRIGREATAQTLRRAGLLSGCTAAFILCGVWLASWEADKVALAEREEFLMQHATLRAVQLQLVEESELTELGFSDGGVPYGYRLLTRVQLHELAEGNGTDRALAAAADDARDGGALLRWEGTLYALVPVGTQGGMLVLSGHLRGSFHLVTAVVLGALLCLAGGGIYVALISGPDRRSLREAEEGGYLDGP